MSEAEPARKDARNRARDSAWEILLAGDRPTQRNVIDRMGGGSPNTVNEVLKDFWRELGERLQRPSVPEAIVQTVDDLWAQAVSEAQSTQRQYRESANVQIDSAQEEMLEAKRKLSATEASLETGQQEIVVLRDRVTGLSSELASTTAHLEEMIRRAELAEANAEELERVLDERLLLHEEKISKERESAKTLNAGLRRQLEDRTAKLEETRQKIKALETEVRVRNEEQQKRDEVLEQRLADLQAQLQSRGEDLTNARTESEALRANLTAVDQARQATEIRTERLEARLEMSEDDRAAMRKQVVALERQGSELRARLDGERKRHEMEREGLVKEIYEGRKRLKDLEAELEKRQSKTPRS
ncbi:MAG: DNA-binding protein [Pseudomonadota bacterium]|nr:DNA-binding protein [Pseudomonadota bacterium]